MESSLTPAKASVQQVRFTFPPSLVSDNAKILLLLCSFFDSREAIPVDLFSLATIPQNRWKVNGEVCKDSVPIELSAEVKAVCTPREHLDEAVKELERALVTPPVNKLGLLEIDARLSRRLRNGLSESQGIFWEQQVILLTTRNVLADILGHRHDQMNLMVAHLTHAASFEQTMLSLSKAALKEFCLALLATCPPGAVATSTLFFKVRRFAEGIPDVDLQLPLKMFEMEHHRGTNGAAWAQSLFNQIWNARQAPNFTHKTNAMVGLALVQDVTHLLRDGKLEDVFNKSKKWQPDSPSDPSLMEALSYFRLGVVRGRAHRYLGLFDDALKILDESHKYYQLIEHLYAHQDYRIWICEKADTLRELGKLESAEKMLRNAIKRKRLVDLPGESILDLSLAEVFFAQGRIKECEELCAVVQKRRSLHGAESCRLNITLGKLHYAKPGGYKFWKEALDLFSTPDVSLATTLMVSSAALTCAKTEEEMATVKHLSVEELEADLPLKLEDSKYVGLYMVSGLLRFVGSAGLV